VNILVHLPPTISPDQARDTIFNALRRDDLSRDKLGVDRSEQLECAILESRGIEDDEMAT
jgi:hypothetical protein